MDVADYYDLIFSKSPEVNVRKIGFPCIYKHTGSVCLLPVTQLTQLFVSQSEGRMKGREVQNNFKKLCLFKTEVFRELGFDIDSRFLCVIKFLLKKLFLNKKGKISN
jgi:hypothetical protein